MFEAMSAVAERELVYLALLTREGLKPLSRWERPLDPHGREGLETLGLRARAVGRRLASGRRLAEWVFSKESACRDAYGRRFHGQPLRQDPRTMRAEGRWFGYPGCCVEHYLAHGYARNDLDPADQRLLFHWACPRCAITPLLLPEYRRIYEQARRWRRGSGVALGRGAAKRGAALERAVAGAASLVAGTLMAAGGAASDGVLGGATDVHWVAVVNPLARLEVDLPYLALHGLEHGRFAFRGDVHGTGRTEVLLAEASHANGPGHLRPVRDDRDGDGLTDEEERYFGSDPERLDTDGNGLADGVQLAREFAHRSHELPREKRVEHVYGLPAEADCYAPCPACGTAVNCGYIDIVNPWADLALTVSYQALHLLERGSFALDAAQRVDPIRLEAVLRPGVLIAPGPGGLRLRWHGVAGRHYEIWSTAVLNSRWQSVAVSVGEGRDLEYSLVPETAQRFYRVSVW